MVSVVVGLAGTTEMLFIHCPCEMKGMQQRKNNFNVVENVFMMVYFNDETSGFKTYQI